MDSNNELAQFPRGQVSFNEGLLRNCTDFDSTFTNGGKLVHTLLGNPAGVVAGKKAVSFSFNLMVDEDGDERDWDTIVDKGLVQTIRLKAPKNVTRTLKSLITEVGYKFAIEDGVARPIKGVGIFVKTK